jgi:hypothetical protein
MKNCIILISLLLCSCGRTKSNESETNLLAAENDLLFEGAKANYDAQKKRDYHFYWFSRKAFETGAAARDLRKIFFTGLKPDSVTVNHKKITWVTIGKDISIYQDVFSDVVLVDSCIVDDDCDIDIYIR